jgi:hypothetical protein
MKNHITRTFLTAFASFTIFSASDSQAANVTLDGSGYYKFTSSARYLSSGAKQYGRYSNLGADYYRTTTISMEWVTNRSSSNSGPLSFEFWGMPYYGADTGIVLMTRSADPLRAGRYYKNRRWQGSAVFLDEYRFPELNLWESTRNGWRFRDALSFRRKNLL